MWYTLLSELTLIVAEQPEKYRALFSTKPDVQSIVVFSLDPSELPLDQVMEELRGAIPEQFSEWFLPSFSTTTERSRFAYYAAFADAVSPYYSYHTYICGLSSVRIDGTTEDWERLLDCWKTITKKLDTENLSPYFDKVTSIIENVLDGDPKFLKKIFWLENCGSGSDTEVYGWFTDLMRLQPEHLRKSCNFSTHIARVRYEHLNTRQKFILKAGLFYSVVSDDGRELRPDFGKLVYEVTEGVEANPDHQESKIIGFAVNWTPEMIEQSKNWVTNFKINFDGEIKLDRA
jgi:hypothetical protein